jgi:hypothetical protein
MKLKKIHLSLAASLILSSCLSGGGGNKSKAKTGLISNISSSNNSSSNSSLSDPLQNVSSDEAVISQDDQLPNENNIVIDDPSLFQEKEKDQTEIPAASFIENGCGENAIKRDQILALFSKKKIDLGGAGSDLSMIQDSSFSDESFFFNYNTIKENICLVPSECHYKINNNQYALNIITSSYHLKSASFFLDYCTETIKKAFLYGKLPAVNVELGGNFSQLTHVMKEKDIKLDALLTISTSDFQEVKRLEKKFDLEQIQSTALAIPMITDPLKIKAALSTVFNKGTSESVIHHYFQESSERIVSVCPKVSVTRQSSLGNFNQMYAANDLNQKTSNPMLVYLKNDAETLTTKSMIFPFKIEKRPHVNLVYNKELEESVISGDEMKLSAKIAGDTFSLQSGVQLFSKSFSKILNADNILGIQFFKRTSKFNEALTVSSCDTTKPIGANDCTIVLVKSKKTSKVLLSEASDLKFLSENDHYKNFPGYNLYIFSFDRSILVNPSRAFNDTKSLEANNSYTSYPTFSSGGIDDNAFLLKSDRQMLFATSVNFPQVLNLCNDVQLDTLPSTLVDVSNKSQFMTYIDGQNIAKISSHFQESCPSGHTMVSGDTSYINSFRDFFVNRLSKTIQKENLYSQQDLKTFELYKNVYLDLDKTLTLSHKNYCYKFKFVQDQCFGSNIFTQSASLKDCKKATFNGLSLEEQKDFITILRNKLKVIVPAGSYVTTDNSDSAITKTLIRPMSNESGLSLANILASRQQKENLVLATVEQSKDELNLSIEQIKFEGAKIIASSEMLPQPIVNLNNINITPTILLPGETNISPVIFTPKINTKINF